MLTLPTHQNRHTLWAIGYGALLLFWLTLEDNTLLIVTLLGTGLSVGLTGLLVLRWFGGRTLTRSQWIPSVIMIGAWIGFGAVWCTVGLMIFKNAWHSHVYPDFSALLIVEMTHRLLPWTLAGGFMGLGGVLWRVGQ